MTATGTFEVKIVPTESSEIGQQGTIGRMTIDKIFSGDLDAVSRGEMLTGNTDETGSMAYVALGRVTGKLAGRDGTFVLMHSATMLKAKPESADLRVTIVPASGTGNLSGLSGGMKINIDASGGHSYTLDYELDDVDQPN